MDPQLKAKVLAQLERIIDLHHAARERAGRMSESKVADWSHFNSSEMEVAKLTTQSIAATERIVGRNSAYMRQIDDIRNSQKYYEGQKLDKIIGVIQSLSEDIEADTIQSITELVHGELFGDFLEMASHLQDEGFKDAAAVIAGSSLEVHLRQLCIKNGVDTKQTNRAGEESPKKAEQMNNDLKGNNVYSGLDNKSVTSWLDLRNKAAHGKYEEYLKEQVGLMIASIRDFITRNPA
jgi:hypothetical protein